MGWIILWAVGVVPAFVLITRRWREEIDVTALYLLMFFLVSLVCSWVVILIMVLYSMDNLIVFKRKNKNQ
jgi:hypothetical protein